MMTFSTVGSHLSLSLANTAFHPSRVGKWGQASAGKEKVGMVHSISGWTRGVQVKLWDPLRTRAIPEHPRGVLTTRRYTNPRLPLSLSVENWWDLHQNVITMCLWIKKSLLSYGNRTAPDSAYGLDFPWRRSALRSALSKCSCWLIEWWRATFRFCYCTFVNCIVCGLLMATCAHSWYS